MPTGTAVVPEQLQELNVNLINQQVCSDTYSYAEFDYSLPYVDSNVDSGFFCSGVESTGFDSCRGDSGGPLIVSGTGVQLGIVSWGANECGAEGTYGVYTNLSYYSDWIKYRTSLGYSYQEYKSVQPLGAQYHDFVYTNYSDQNIDFSYASPILQGSDVDASIISDECSDRGILGPGQSCAISISYNNGEYGSKLYGLYLSYTLGGTTSNIVSYLEFEVATTANSLLESSIPWLNTGVYSNEYQWTAINNGIRAASVGDTQESTVFIDGIPPSQISFDIILSTELYRGLLYIYANGEFVDALSGEGEFNVQNLSLPLGSNRIKLTYRNSGSSAAGNDSVQVINMRSDSSTTVSNTPGSDSDGDSSTLSPSGAPDSGDSSTSSPSGSSESGGSLGWLTLALFGLLPLRKRIQ